jgi:hypothetical protein
MTAEPEWSDDDPVIFEQPATWVFWNPHGQLVIRQRGEVFDDDPAVFLSIEYVPALIGALRQKLSEYASAEADPPEPPAELEAAERPLTAAERQRRRRHKRDKCHESHETSHESHEPSHEPALPLPPVTTG